MRTTGNNHNQLTPTSQDNTLERRGRFEVSGPPSRLPSSETSPTRLTPPPSIPPSTPTRRRTAPPTNLSATLSQQAANILLHVEPSTPPPRPQLTSPPPLIRQNGRANIEEDSTRFDVIRTVLFPLAEQRNGLRNFRTIRNDIPEERRRAYSLINRLRSSAITTTELAELLQLDRPAIQNSNETNTNPSISGPSRSHNTHNQASSSTAQIPFSTFTRFEQRDSNTQTRFSSSSSTFSEINNDVLLFTRRRDVGSFLARALALVRPPTTEPQENNSIEILDVVQRLLEPTEPRDPNQMPPLVEELASIISASTLQRLISDRFPSQPDLDRNGNELKGKNVALEEFDEDSFIARNSLEDKPQR